MRKLKFFKHPLILVFFVVILGTILLATHLYTSYAGSLPPPPPQPGIVGSIVADNDSSNPSSIPIPDGTQVSLIDSNGNTIASTSTVGGMYSFTNIASGNYYLKISNSNNTDYSTWLPNTFSMTSAGPFIDVDGSDNQVMPTLSFDFVPSAININLEDSLGNPVSSSKVVANNNSGGSITTTDGSESFNVQASSVVSEQSSGPYPVLNVLPGGTYTVCAQGVDGSTYCMQNVAAGSTTTFNFPTLYSYSGQVDLGGQPVGAGVSINLTSADGVNSATATTDSSGNFSANYLPNNSYYVNVTDTNDNSGTLSDFNLTSSNPYVVVDGANVSESDLSFGVSPINISVTNQINAPVSNAYIYSTDDNTNSVTIPSSADGEQFISNPGITASNNPQTDQNGNATINTFPGESYNVCTVNPDTGIQYCAQTAGSTQPITLNYASDYSASGTFLLNGSQFRDGVSVYAYGSNSSSSVVDSNPKFYTTSTYTLNGLIDGDDYLGFNDGTNPAISAMSINPVIDISNTNTTVPDIDINTVTVPLTIGSNGGEIYNTREMIIQTSDNPIYAVGTSIGFSGLGSGYTLTGTSAPSSSNQNLVLFPDQTYSICLYDPPSKLPNSGINTCTSFSSNVSSLEIEPSNPLTISYATNPVPNSAGWNNSPVTVTFNCTDSDSCTAPTTISSDGANQVVTGTAVNLNSVGVTTSTNINLDQTPPTVSSPAWSSNPITLGQSTNLSVPATDNLSGVVGGEYYIGTTDPGDGNGTPMTWNGTDLTTSFGPNLNPGIYQVNVRSVDAAGNWSPVTTTTLTVTSPYTLPSITSPSIQQIDARVPVSLAITTTGDPAPAVTESGTLPPELTFVDNGDGTATISGQASTTNNGIYLLTITATNSVGSVTQNLYIDVDDAVMTPTIISGDSVTGTYGSPLSFTVDTTGDPIPNITKTGSLPPGLTFKDNNDGTATISGTPTGSANGLYTLAIKAKSNQGSVTQTFNLTINDPPTINGIPNQTATVGTPFSLNIASSGTPLPSFTSTSLPSGLALTDNGNGTATISGTPSVGSGASYSVTVTATNAYGSNNNTFVLKVYEPPTITSASSASTTVGSQFSFQVSSTGYQSASYSETGSLPSGVTLKSLSGILSGTPKAGTAGTYNFTIIATNSLGTSSQSFTLTVH